MKLAVDKRRFFPDPAKPTLDGIVAMSDELTVDSLLEAYSFGIFPWPYPELPCLWFCPDERGVLDFKDLHIPHSLEKFMRKTSWQITFDKCFSPVIRECARIPRANQSGTWVTEPIISAYEKFHKAGYAHSVECWEGDQLIGGLYGVYVAGVFSGESMFYKKTNASKLCFLKLIEKLKANGLSWIDIQMVTPITEQMGGQYIAKKDFLKRLAMRKAVAEPIHLV